MPAVAHDGPTALGPARFVTISFDDLGVNLQGRFRVAGLSPDTRRVLQSASPHDVVGLVERSLVIGLSTIASASAVDAATAAQQRLAEAADEVSSAVRDLRSTRKNRDDEMEQKIGATIRGLKETLSATREEDQRSRALLRTHAEDIAKTAQAMNISRAELETRTVRAAQTLTEAQAKSTTALLTHVDATLRKLVNPDEPGSATAILDRLFTSASTDMKTATDAHLEHMSQRLARLLGPDSPFLKRLIDASREDVERGDRRVLEQLDKLRETLIVSDTRRAHDPTIKGETYEEKICALLEPAAMAYALTVHGTGRDTGEQAGSKKGDVVLADETMTARIALEARARKGVSMRAAIDELTGTATNRGVKVVAYVVPGREYLPAGASEFSRGGIPFSYKRLPGDVHAMIAVIDPDDVLVAERVAVLVWLLERMSTSIIGSRAQENLTERVTGALAYAGQAVQHLSVFRQIKANLTGASSQIDKARENVDRVQRMLEADLTSMQEQLGKVA